MTDTYLTRQTLLRQLKIENNNLAWEEFLHYYKRFIYSIVVKMEIAPSERDDIVQEALFKIWKSLDQFDINKKRGRFRNWMQAITKNTALVYINKNARLMRNVQDFTDQQADQINKPDIDQLIEFEWEQHITALAFANISKKASNNAVESFLAGLRNEPAEDTAQRLNITVEKVYNYRNRIKTKMVGEIKNLREMLE